MASEPERTERSGSSVIERVLLYLGLGPADAYGESATRRSQIWTIGWTIVLIITLLVVDSWTARVVTFLIWLLVATVIVWLLRTRAAGAN